MNSVKHAGERSAILVTILMPKSRSSTSVVATVELSISETRVITSASFISFYQMLVHFSQVKITYFIENRVEPTETVQFGGGVRTQNG